MDWIKLLMAISGCVGFVFWAAGWVKTSYFRALLIGLTSWLIGAALLGSLLAAFETFHAGLVFGLNLLLGWSAFGLASQARGKKADRDEISAAKKPLLTRNDLLIAGIMLVAAPFAASRTYYLYTNADAGIYATSAVHLATHGHWRCTLSIPPQLEGPTLTLYEAHNLMGYTPTPKPFAVGFFLPGTYIEDNSANSYYFQFLPGWPVVMALFYGIGDLEGMFWAPLVLFFLVLGLFGLILDLLGLQSKGLAAAIVLFAGLPLLVQFSKYHTTEMMVLWLVTTIVYLLMARQRFGLLVACSAMAVLVFTHISSFLYAPIFAAVGLWAVLSQDRILLRFSLVAFGLMSIGLFIGYYFSPQYTEDIFLYSFAFFKGLPGWGSALFVAVCYLVVMGTLLLLKGPHPLAQKLSAQAKNWAERPIFWTILFGLALSAMLAYQSYSGYLLGFTDAYDPAVKAPKGAWNLRANYAGQGWSALLHLNWVSFVWGTAWVGLPLALWTCLRHARQLVADKRLLYFAIALFWTLAVYTFLRVDTPYNYYASRYYLPVLVPAAMVLCAWCLDRLALPLVLVLVISALFVQAPYLNHLRLNPENQGELAFLQAVEARVPAGSTLFIESYSPLYELLALHLDFRKNIQVIQVPGDNTSIAIGNLGFAMGLDHAYYLHHQTPSDSDLPLSYPYYHHPQQAKYPLENVGGIRHFFLSKLGPHHFRKIQMVPQSRISFYLPTAEELVLESGQQTSVQLQIKNLTDQTWLPEHRTSQLKEAVRLGLRCRQAATGDVVVLQTARFPLPDEVPADGRIVVDVPLAARTPGGEPLAPGTYHLNFALLQEHVTWFDGPGHKTLEWTLRVIPAKP